MSATFDPPKPGSSFDPFVANLPSLPTLPSPTAPTAFAAAITPTLPTPQPVAARPEPAFDAKAMVDSQRRRVENPVYGDIPHVLNEESKAAIELARKRMRQQRRKNEAFAKGLLLVLLLILAGCLAGLYVLFQADQEADEPDPTTPPTAVPIDAAAQPGAATPLGEQGQVIDAMDDLNSGAMPSAGGLMDAIDDAKQVVGETNGNATADAGASTMMRADVFPDGIATLATDIGPSNGYERYLIDLNLATATSPDFTTQWLGRLRALPQSATPPSDASLMPPLGPGQMSVALVATPEGAVQHLVVYAPEQTILIVV